MLKNRQEPFVVRVTVIAKMAVNIVGNVMYETNSKKFLTGETKFIHKKPSFKRKVVCTNSCYKMLNKPISMQNISACSSKSKKNEDEQAY